MIIQREDSCAIWLPGCQAVYIISFWSEVMTYQIVRLLVPLVRGWLMYLVLRLPGYHAIR